MLSGLIGATARGAARQYRRPPGERKIRGPMSPSSAHCAARRLRIGELPAISSNVNHATAAQGILRGTAAEACSGRPPATDAIPFTLIQADCDVYSSNRIPCARGNWSDQLTVTVWRRM